MLVDKLLEKGKLVQAERETFRFYLTEIRFVWLQ